jgi:hypothetical protein
LQNLTLALKSLVDELPSYPDLDLELHEYALPKSEDSVATDKFRASVKAMLID